MTPVFGTRPSERPGRAAGAGSLALAAFAGLGDCVARGAGLSPLESLQTVGLWMALGAPLALAAGLAAALAARLAPRRLGGARAALLVLCGVAQGGAVGGLALGAFGAGVAAGIALAGVALLVGGPGHTRALRNGALVLGGLALAGAPLWAAWGGGEPPPAPSPPVAAAADAPHVVLVVLDTLRADHLGAYGHPGGLSPNLDALATESTLYERCFAPASWTVPSHASLFTGLPPRTHGAHFLEHRWLDDRFVTLAEALRGRGYRTAGFAANQQLSLANLEQGFDTWRIVGEPFRHLVVRRAAQLLGLPNRWADEGAADAVRRVDRALAMAPADGHPRFVFVNLLEPHWRYLPPLGDRLGAAPPGQDTFGATRRAGGFYGPLAMAGPEVPDDVAEAVRAFYAAEVRYQDRQLGRLLAVLDRHLDLDRTLLLITADHGENLGEGGRWDHVFALNDALVHVPMILRLPGRLPAGVREPGLCSLLDVPATVADVVGGLDLAPGPGRSLLPGTFRPRPVVFAQGDPYLGHLERMGFVTGFERDVAGFADLLLSARDGRFKYVLSSRDGGRLYDLDRDPAEARDVGDAHPARTAALAAALDAWLDRTPRYAPDARGEARALDAREREQLESLGYVQ